MPEPLYLDFNATAPIRPEVADALHQALLRFAGNPSSQHVFGRAAKQALEDARDRSAELLGAAPGKDRALFTSGGTEANNLALFGLAELAARERSASAKTRRLATGPGEHPSVARAAEQLQHRGWQWWQPPVGKLGLLEPAALTPPDGQFPLVASVALAHSETGVVQPIGALARAVHSQGSWFHTDAVQAVGKIPVCFRELEVDALTCTAHKFQGPLGVGLLLIRAGVRPEPLFRGGFQQDGLRPGTECTALAIAFCRALELAVEELAATERRLAALRKHFEARIQTAWPTVVVVGEGTERLPNTSNLAFPGLDRQTLVMALDVEGIACSSGSACASGSSEPSAVHVAMGLPEAVRKGAVRFSFGPCHNLADADAAADRILLVCKRLSRI